MPQPISATWESEFIPSMKSNALLVISGLPGPWRVKAEKYSQIILRSNSCIDWMSDITLSFYCIPNYDGSLSGSAFAAER
ncbi:hypothetical protein DESC_710084 [Desulfosarcina cetonica]|nr:hypothetical protein DESC_710084 [Desulfosarcina cetonica]